MKKLAQLFGVNMYEGPYVGIEIECEGNGMAPLHSKFWKTVDDGSLRGAFPEERAEFVSSEPVPKALVKEAIHEIANHCKNFKMDFSFRTSTHVHVNVTDLNSDQVNAFLYTYFLLEKELMQYCGESRNSNRFCLRMVDSDTLIRMFEFSIREGVEHVFRYIDENSRYAAANLASLRRFGTIEFRGMRGTLEEQVLNNWIEALLRLREFGEKNPDILTIFDKARDYDKFFEEVLGDLAPVFRTGNLKNNMDEALSLLVNIPFIAKSRKGLVNRPKDYRAILAGARRNPDDLARARFGDEQVFVEHIARNRDRNRARVQIWDVVQEDNRDLFPFPEEIL